MTAPVFGETRLCPCKGKSPCYRGCESGVLRAPTRSGDPETSFAAAESISSERIRWSQSVILNVLKKHGPMTDEALYRVSDVNLNMSESGARTRRHELVTLGKVEDSGRTETLKSGRRAVVWRVVE